MKKFNPGDMITLKTSTLFRDINVGESYEVLTVNHMNNGEYVTVAINSPYTSETRGSYSADFFELDKQTIRNNKIETICSQ